MRTKNMNPGCSNRDPWVIHPYYTGRDKGALITKDDDGVYKLMTFYSVGRAWKYVFDVEQPNDNRACDNYRVIRLSEYEAC